jgi:4-amino-4-deoxy-L-arabinose transferase-like glycosyltransferase
MRVWRFPVGVDVSTHQRGDDRPRYRRGRLILGVGVLLLVVAAVWWFFWSGGFRFQPEHGETFWHLLHQKGHWYLEMVISGVETILFDLLIGVIGWRYLLRPYIAERQRRAVEDDHALHGILDHDGRRTRAEGVGH